VKAHSSRRPVDAPHVERAYRDLKAGIVKGRYRPGASLSEVSLASEHGMSRTPIREGLARLWQEARTTVNPSRRTCSSIWPSRRARGTTSRTS
jgi:DNA-binding GntR family transcriptional regulator